MSEPHTTADSPRRDDSRRGFIRGSSLLLAGALPSAAITTAAAAATRGSLPNHADDLKIGLIGCGYQGISVVSDVLNAANAPVPWRLTAVADVFPDRLQQALRTLRGRHGNQIAIDGASRFVGLQAYQDLLATDVDVVVLATPPVFRPVQFEAAIASGKHVYAELPVAIDVRGAERFRLAASSASAQRRVVAIGLSHRHDPRFQRTIEQLQCGAIGQILSIQAGLSRSPKKIISGPKSQTAFEMQLRNWWDYPWASGGSLVERRVQSLDLVNWLLNSHPLEARYLERDMAGGIQDPNPGQLDDLSSVEFTYAGGVKLLCENLVGPGPRGKWLIQGSAGWCDLAAGKIFNARNELQWQAADELPTPQLNTGLTGGDKELQAETAQRTKNGNQGGALMSALASNSGLNQGVAAIESTLAAILGRMAASERRRVTWEECLQSREVFDCIAGSPADLAVDRHAVIERY